MSREPSDARDDREYRDICFERCFANRPNRAVIKRPVFPGERAMRRAPEPWLVITPDFPRGISTKEWEQLGEDEQTYVARFWYMSNYQPNSVVGPDDRLRDRTNAFNSGADTSEFTNMTEYICERFGPRSLAVVGTNVEAALHPIARAWKRASRLEIYANEEQLLQAIQLAAVGIKHEYREVERRLNHPVAQTLKISEDLITTIEDIVASVTARDKEAASRKIGWVSTITEGFGKGLAESAEKRAEGVITPYVMTHAIPLYHRLIDLIHYVKQFIGNIPFH
jgi:hypothetical protein